MTSMAVFRSYRNVIRNSSLIYHPPSRSDICATCPFRHRAVWNITDQKPHFKHVTERLYLKKVSTAKDSLQYHRSSAGKHVVPKEQLLYSMFIISRAFLIIQIVYAISATVVSSFQSINDNPTTALYNANSPTVELLSNVTNGSLNVSNFGTHQVARNGRLYGSPINLESCTILVRALPSDHTMLRIYKRFTPGAFETGQNLPVRFLSSK